MGGRRGGRGEGEWGRKRRGPRDPDDTLTAVAGLAFRSVPNDYCLPVWLAETLSVPRDVNATVRYATANP